jgi:hypothetical protein
MEIKVESVSIKIDDRTISLTIEQAKMLYQRLGELFKDNQYTIITYPQPYYHLYTATWSDETICKIIPINLNG